MTITGFIDSTVMVDLSRKYPVALVWVQTSPPLGISSTAWMEAVQGAPDKPARIAVLKLLDMYELVFSTESDAQWAMAQQMRFGLSYKISIEDYLIATTAARYGLPLYTHNLKHMTPLMAGLAVKPY